MLIDSSFFTKGSRHILNATSGTMPNANSEEVAETIAAFVEENQEAFLRSMLGHKTGNKLHTYLVSLDEEEDARHIEDFDSLCNKLKEPFADYVFFHILRYINSQATVTGLVRLKCANEYVPPIQRQVDCWNNMVEKNRLFAVESKNPDFPVKGITVSEDMLTRINIFNL